MFRKIAYRLKITRIDLNTHVLEFGVAGVLDLDGYANLRIPWCVDLAAGRNLKRYLWLCPLIELDVDHWVVPVGRASRFGIVLGLV